MRVVSKAVKRKLQLYKSMLPLLVFLFRAIKGPSKWFLCILQFSIEQAVDENENEGKMKCILICLLIFCCGFASEILALRCASADGLSVEDVRKGKQNKL